MSKIQTIEQANGKRLIFTDGNDGYLGSARYYDDEGFVYSDDVADCVFINGYDVSMYATADQLRQIADAMDKAQAKMREGE